MLPLDPSNVGQEPPISLTIGPLELRAEELSAFIDGARVDLTVREFEVLQALAERPDRVVSREVIYDRVWGGRMPHRDRAVDVHVKRIRQKLSDTDPNRVFVHTHFGVGYRLAPQAAAPEVKLA